MWLLYLYFIREALVDLYDLIEDSFDWAFSGTPWMRLPAISRFINALRDDGLVVLANGAILIIWSLYNQVRFRAGNDRSRGNDPVTVADLAELYGVPAADVAAWQQARILVMTHALDGTLSEVVSKDREIVPAAPAKDPAFQPAGR